MIIKNRNNFFLMGEAGDGDGSAGPTLEERMAAPAGTYSDEFVDPAAPPATPPANAGDPPKYTPNPFWEQLRDVEGFEMPTEITAANEFELMKPFMEKKLSIQPKPNLHPLAQSIQSLVEANPELTMGDIIKQINPETMSPETMSNEALCKHNFVKKYGTYDESTNPDGLTQEDIDAEVDSMTRIQKLEMARATREELIAEREAKLNSFTINNQQTQEQAIASANEAIEKSIPQILAEVSKTNDIYGIKFSQPELTSHLEEYKEFLKPDPKTGDSKFAQWLSNDLNLFQAWLLQVKIGENNMKEIFTETREGSKKQILEALSLTPRLAGGQGTIRKLDDPSDPEVQLRMSAPAGTYKAED